MKLFPTPLDIEETEGFDKNDIFGRAHFASGLMNLFDTVADPLVVALDGEWGSGKSTFLKMWAGELRKAGFPVVYFDAFENDYVDDAFLAIAGEIISLAEAKKPQTTKDQFVEKAKGAGKALLRSGLRLGIKGASIGILDMADIEALRSDIAGELSNFVDRYIGELLEQRQQQKNAVIQFKNALSELPSLLSTVSPPKPLIFIIDELDRCKPLFALQILERIKHFFAVKNINFVLGVHLPQLQTSVASAYGNKLDATRYLQKFIHLTIPLPNELSRQNKLAATEYLEHISKTIKPKQGDDDRIETSVRVIQHISSHRNITLRDIEQIWANIVLSISFTDINYFMPPPILAGLCVLKVTDFELFKKGKSGQLTIKEVNEPLCLEKDDRQGHIQSFLRMYWHIALDETINTEYQAFYRDIGLRYHIEDRKKIVPVVANRIIDFK
jgi:hypothetical protein